MKASIETILRSIIVGTLIGSVMSCSPTRACLPFCDLDLSDLNPKEREIFEEAQDDFRAVMEGKEPIHAEVDVEAPLPLDGGTSFYKGKGYYIVALRSISSFGGVHGYVRGPILSFDESFASGNTKEISCTRFFQNQIPDNNVVDLESSVPGVISKLDTH